MDQKQEAGLDTSDPVPATGVMERTISFKAGTGLKLFSVYYVYIC